MDKLVEPKECCGCGVCMNVCKFDAIHMKEDDNGFLYPVIDADKCVNCGMCTKHCPILVHDKIQIGCHHIDNYAGYLKNRTELLQSASGGAATALARTVLQQGGVVFGVSYVENFRKARTRKVTTQEELNSVRDSKYMQSDKGMIYQEVREELEQGTKVLYTGTPCDIGAVKAFLGKEYDNLYTCELICHGPTTYQVAERYLAEQERKYKSKVVSMSVRSKDNGWKVPHIKLEFENGKELIQKFYRSDYGIAFSVLNRESCYHCDFKGDRKVADITVGDFWGADEKEIYWNADGISAIHVHTERGRKLLQTIEELALFPVGYNTVLKGNVYLEKSIPHNRVSKLFGCGMRCIGLHKTVMLYGWYRNVVRRLKNKTQIKLMIL